jgi:photosystem II stability/assembly factor-like uncharacterized protein
MAQAVSSHVLVLAGTRDGVYLLNSDRERAEWHLSGPFLAGHDVCHVLRDGRDGRLWAAANPRDGKPEILASDDEGQTWTRCGELPDCERAWHVRPGRAGENGRVWAGIMPATLLRSDDRGRTWHDIPGLNAHPTRPEWWPGGGGLCLHTIILPDGAPGRVYAGVSVAGFFRSDDDGETWIAANEGTKSMAEMIAAETGSPVAHQSVHRCVHKVVLDPGNPETLFMQQHEGVYRSDDGGRSWRDIGGGLPSPFGFPVVAAAAPGSAGCRVWVIPENDETIRTDETQGLRVWRTDDGGESWTPSVNGLPKGEHNVLREGMAADALDPAGVYFGTTAGALYASTDGGAHWSPIAEGLPRIQSVEVAPAMMRASSDG